MSPLHGRRRAEAARRLLAAAEGQLGLEPLADGTTPYGVAAGSPRGPWDGALVDWCLAAARTEAGGLELPGACARPADALAELARARRLRRRPAPGDVAFLADASRPGGLRAAIVADGSRWDADGSVQTIEGDVTGGLPRGPERLAVHRRTRYAPDVVAFGRPALARARKPLAEEVARELPLVLPAHLTTGRRSRAVELLQLALADCTEGRGFERGALCPRTRSALARFQRSIGHPAPDLHGTPDPATLRALAARTGRFRTE